MSIMKGKEALGTYPDCAAARSRVCTPEVGTSGGLSKDTRATGLVLSGVSRTGVIPDFAPVIV